MPGLLRGVARTAVVAGTATAVSGRVQRRQASRYAEKDAQIYAQQDAAYAAQMQQQQPQYAPPPPQADGGDDVIEQLKELAALKSQGILTDEEFAAQKAKLLNS
jgi:Short C-terminal domain